jgi:hypothetical protein
MPWEATLDRAGKNPLYFLEEVSFDGTANEGLEASASKASAPSSRNQSQILQNFFCGNKLTCFQPNLTCAKRSTLHIIRNFRIGLIS